MVRQERILLFPSAVASLAFGAADAALAGSFGIRGQAHGRSQNDEDQRRQREQRRGATTGASAAFHLIDNTIRVAPSQSIVVLSLLESLLA